MHVNKIEITEDHEEAFIPVSDRDNLYIIHSGHPPPEHKSFSKPPSPKTKWPDGLWGEADVIYNIKDPSQTLGPPTSPDDTTLRFDSRFESGNLSRAFKLQEDVYHLILEFDHNPSGSCMWFYFQVSNTRKDKKYRFYISGFHKEESLYTQGHRVFFYSEKRARTEDISWTRSGSKYAYSVTSRTKTKLKRATLQFQIKFPYDNDTCYIANSLPYTYTDMLHSIEIWKSKAPPGTMHVENFAQTICCRDVPIITLTNLISPVPLAGKSCIFLTGRIHPGESQGSYVLHGLIDFLISDHPYAHYILDHCIVKIVPMMAVDGVVEGSYRVSMMGHDLNRVWTNPNPVFHPVVYKTKELIKETAIERPIVVYIDFHGHSSLHGTFAFGCPNQDDCDLKDAEKTLPRLFAFLSDEFSWENCVFTFPKDRKDAGRIVVRQEMGVIQSFTIETSIGGVKAGPNAGMLYDEILWKQLGQKCAEAIYHLLIPTTSPLYSYVNKELDFFAPRPTKKIRPKKTKEYESKAHMKMSLKDDPWEEIQGRRIKATPVEKKFVIDPNMITEVRPPSRKSVGYNQVFLSIGK